MARQGARQPERRREASDRGTVGLVVKGAGVLAAAAMLLLPAAPVGSWAGASEDEPDIKLYQLLYDYEVTEPLSTLGQKVRILIWIRYMDLSTAQQELLLALARKFRERRAVVERETRAITEAYERRLEPIYERIYQEVTRPVPDQKVLDELARELHGVIIAHSAADELHTMRVRMLRTVLSDETSFLHSLSPEQEEKLVTSLFFLRQEVDPFANPQTYRDIIGPTWNAGDFSSLLKRSRPRNDHLNIGGLWGLDLDEENRINYADIRRPIVLFYVLKQDALVPALEESLRLARGERVISAPPPP